MDYRRVVSEAERKYGLPPGLLASVWQQESGGSTDLGLQGPQLSRGRGAAVGPFQIVPYYHPEANLDSFESQADYDGYNEHPDHVAFVRDVWLPSVADFVELDYVDASV